MWFIKLIYKEYITIKSRPACTDIEIQPTESLRCFVCKVEW